MKFSLPGLLISFSACLACSTLYAQEDMQEASGSTTSIVEVQPADEPVEPGEIVEVQESEPVEGSAAPSLQTMPVEESGAVESGTVLDMPQAQASDDAGVPISLPQHGMKMDEVERRYGAPISRDPAIGNPPITRWNYPGFSVFFEHRTVLHAVQKDRPAEIYRKDELLPTPVN